MGFFESLLVFIAAILFSAGKVLFYFLQGAVVAVLCVLPFYAWCKYTDSKQPKQH